MPKRGFRKYDTDMIASLCDGSRTSLEISDIVGCPQKYVQDQMVKQGLHRLPRGARRGELNPSYKTGRTIDLDGYVLVPAPGGHPFARVMPGKNFGRILEHRLLMEHKICRYLYPDEVVDHIDGLHIHNNISNLRLFACNADHLKQTIKGRVPRWSKSGYKRIKSPHRDRVETVRIDIYNLNKKAGDVRLKQILLAWLSLGKDSPFLLGTHMYLERVQIDWTSQTMIKQALAALNLRLAQDLLT